MSAAAPFFAELAEAPPNGHAVWLRAADGVRVRAAFWPGERGTAVVFPGRTEYIEKYGRMAARLQARGLGVAVIDWRGQGLSDRLGRRLDLGHVEHFGHYQRDWAALAASEDFARLPEPRFLFAHSMGGCIGLRTLLGAHPFAAAVFSAPMWGLHLRAVMRQSAEFFSVLARRLGLPARRWGRGGAVPLPVEDSFARNVLTGDRDIYDWLQRQLLDRPELALGGPSRHWVTAAFAEMARLSAAPPPGLPVLAFLGSAEEVVSVWAIRRQMARMPRGRLVELAGARHEIWMERPELQEAVWAEIDRFLECHVPRAAEVRRSAGGA